MRYFQNPTILSAAFLVFTFVYVPLRGFPFGIDAALCVTFTVLVFSYAVRRRGLTLFSPPKTPSPSPRSFSPTPSAFSPSSSSSERIPSPQLSCQSGSHFPS
jgi:hypothetical protein